MEGVAEKLRRLLDCNDLYRLKGRLRADDLLVRNRAGAELQAAGNMVRDLAGRYHLGFVPPSTRENPFPAPEVTRTLAELDHLERDVSDVETSIRGQAVPGRDRVWDAVRDELGTLDLLLQFDLLLITQAQEVREEVGKLDAAALSPGWDRGVREKLNRLKATLKDRSAQLEYQVF